MSESPWSAPREQPSLDDRGVHVWRISLDLGATGAARFAPTLSPDERRRAARFHFARDRDRFTVARGVLRTLLGGYLGIAPAELAFAYGDHGKPELVGGPLRFNVSHSAGVALCAVTRVREVGVDVEAHRGDFATEEIADRFFSSAERTALRALPARRRCEAFFACWTRKEAYIKARGLGLSLALDAFDVSLVPGEPATLLATRDDPAQKDRWSLRALDPGPGFAGALVAEGRDWTLSCWQWKDA